jgi:hypothetical protein
MMMMMMMFQHGCSYVLVGDLHGKLRLCDRMLGCGTDGDIYLMATCNDTTSSGGHGGVVIFVHVSVLTPIADTC